ncbi:MAG: hypothetical protein ACRC1Z_15795 [Waterburya sp.]
MKRDKLLTIRISEEKRKAFNSWCERRNYSSSGFLYEIIEDCLDNSIDPSILTETSLSGKNIDIKRQQQLDKRIDNLEQVISRQSIDLERVKQLDKRIDKLEQISQRVEKLERFAFSSVQTAKRTKSEQLNSTTKLVDQQVDLSSKEKRLEGKKRERGTELQEKLRQQAVDILWAKK